METARSRKNGASTNGSRLVFDHFVVDPVNRTVSRDGSDIVMTGKDFELLVFFALNPGRLLEKDELMAAVWADTIVEENNLTQNISALRRLFGEKPGEHRFIVTVPGRGYKFVPQVR